MKRSIRLLHIILTFVFSLMFVNCAVRAGTISTLNVTEGTSDITVSGQTSEDVSAVSISVFDEDSLELVAVKTASVDDENKYSQIIPLDEGTYTVKVADYTGGVFSVKENVVVGEKAESVSTTETELNSNELNIDDYKSDEENNSEGENRDEDIVVEGNLPANPKTLDNILMFILLSILSVFCLFVLAKNIRKKPM